MQISINRASTDITNIFPWLFHGHSSIFPWPSLLSILHSWHFAENIAKCRLSTRMLNFSVVAKNINFARFWDKIEKFLEWQTKFHDFWPILHVSWLVYDHFPVSVGTHEPMNITKKYLKCWFCSDRRPLMWIPPLAGGYAGSNAESVLTIIYRPQAKPGLKAHSAQLLAIHSLCQSPLC